MDLGDLRREYRSSGLQREQLAADPVSQFETWFNEAQASGMADTSAMTVATVNADGQPSQRTVLLKYFDQDGFVFFTNTESTKAHEIAGNPRVCLLFPWYALDRQVIIRGSAEVVSAAMAARYFLSRPRDSQIAHWVSEQSRPLDSRQLLLGKFNELKQKLGAGEMPVPSSWGGYRVVPQTVEFWQGREHRLHDRFVYARQANSSWSIERLAP